ncbi:MAG: hypothetical protein RJA81_1855 [Planctomycetota bacterium]
MADKKILLEVPVETLDDAISATRGGADRLELCASLEVGGLSPSESLLKVLLQEVATPVVAMVRPRSGGCFYTDRDFQVMLAQRDALIKAGASGIVFGFLDKDGHIDENRLDLFIKDMPDFIETVFHRAFDLVADAGESLELLISKRITRVLTSGLSPSASEGIAVLKSLVRQAGQRIEILAGGGIRMENVSEIITQTGVHQIHSSCRATAQDRSPRLRPEIRFGLPQLTPETEHRRTDAGLVACMRAAILFGAE